MTDVSPESKYHVPDEEWERLLRDPAAMEERAARMCPDVYVKGLEIGTIAFRGMGCRSDSDYEDKAAYTHQRELVEAEGWAALNVDDIDEWEWSVKALSFGMDAGRSQPLELFEVQGVKA